MKWPILGLCAALSLPAILAAGASPAPAPSPSPSPKLSKWQQREREMFQNSAPADEYFGRLKLSYLGMNNTFRDSSISSGQHSTDAAIIAKVGFAENALDDWAAKYPRDPELARTYFLALQVERKLWIKANQDRAWVILNRLAHDFATTYFGKLAKQNIAIGFTEHYYALPFPCATPAPSPSPTPSSNETAPPAGAAPVDTPSPAPTPTASPTPGPTETTLASGVHVQVIPQACIPPPSPAPTPSPEASPPAPL